MPTFDFQCADCSKFFEFQRPFGSTEVPACPKCSSKNTEKLISTPNIVFKGEGFYVTDNASGKQVEKKEDPSKESKEAGEAKEAKDNQSKEKEPKETRVKESKSPKNTP